MKNKLPIDQIQDSENAPSNLKKLSKDFLETETIFNLTYSNLIDEKKELERKINSEKEILERKYEKEKITKEKAFNQGDYIPDIVN